MFSVTSTGTCCLPLWTAIVSPTISGRIIERRDQVLIGRLLLVATASSTYFIRLWSTNGPLRMERGTAAYLEEVTCDRGAERSCRRCACCCASCSPWSGCPTDSPG